MRSILGPLPPNVRRRRERRVLALLLLAALLTLPLYVWVSAQEELSQKVVRLHVLANSDSEEDQAIKLRVRDALLQKTAPLLQGAENRETAQRLLRQNLPALSAAAREELWRAGRADAVSLSLTESYFPTRHYGDVALPAGDYPTLRVTIGAGAGHNWWCVIFPPLCTQTATESRPAQTEWGELTPQEVALVTGEEGYVLRFRVVEWWGKLRHLFD